nr:integrase, catalytic region, zinc finger, CCHC-type, peptidase aspartic, catalytic [Tanacetum cinerariifolium]
MLATGRYPQWRLRFLLYIDTRPNGEALRKCILSGPYKSTTVVVQAVAATDDSSAIPEHTIVETPMNISRNVGSHRKVTTRSIPQYSRCKDKLILGICQCLISSTTSAKMVKKEVNELRAERLAKNANPLALVATAQANQDLYYQTPKSQKSYAPSLKPSIPTRSRTTTRYKGKEIAKPITPPSESTNLPTTISELPQTQETRMWIRLHGSPVVQQSEIQCFNYKEYGHFAKGCRKLKRVKDSAYHKEKMLLCKQAEKGVPLQVEQYDWLADTDEEIDDNTCSVETDDSNAIPDSPDIKTLGESNSVRDSCLVALQNKQTELEKYKAFKDRIVDYDKLEPKVHADLRYVESLQNEIDEPESDKAEFSNLYDMILQESVSNEIMCTYLLSLSDLDALAKLPCLYLHKVKECDCLAQKLSKQPESVSNEVHNELLQRFAKVEKHSISLEIALQKYLKAQLQDKNIAISELKKLIKKGKGKSMKTKFDKPYFVRQPNAQRIPKPSVLGKPAPFSDSLERKYFSNTKSVPKTNVSQGLSKPITAQTLPQTARQAISNTYVLKPEMYRIDNRTTQTRAPQSPQTIRNTNPRVSTSIGVNHKTNVSRPQHRSNQLKDKVVPNNSQVKLKKTQVEKHLRISGISNQIKSVTACNDSLNSKTSNNDVNARTKKPNVVPISTRKPKGHANKSVATPHKKKVASKSNNQKPKSYYRMLLRKQFAPILGYGVLVQGNITINWVYYVKGHNHNLFSVGQFCDADLEVAFRKSTCFVRDLQDKMKEKGDPCILVGYSTQSKGYRVYNKRKRLIIESTHIQFDEIKEISETYVANNTSGLVLQRQKASDYDNSDPVPQLQNVSSSADAHVPSQQELDLLFGPLYVEFFTAVKIEILLEPTSNKILVKENQEKDKIRSKPDENGKPVKAEKSLKQLQSVEGEKLNKTQREGSKMQIQSKAIQV